VRTVSFEKETFMATPHSIVTIVGSLRKDSHTLKVAKALAKLAPASLELDVTTLHDISFFNQDLEASPPADWVAFREKLQKSSGVLFVTPEYNRSIPGCSRTRSMSARAPMARVRSSVSRPASSPILPDRSAASARPSICRISCRASPVRSWGSRKPI